MKNFHWEFSRTHRLELFVGLLVSPEPRGRPRSWWHVGDELRFFCKRNEGSTNGDPDANEAAHLREDRSCTVTDWAPGFSGNYSLLVIVVLFVVQSLHLVDLQRVIVLVQSRLHLNMMPLMLPHQF